MHMTKRLIEIEQDFLTLTQRLPTKKASPTKLRFHTNSTFTISTFKIPFIDSSQFVSQYLTHSEFKDTSKAFRIQKAVDFSFNLLPACKCVSTYLDANNSKIPCDFKLLSCLSFEISCLTLLRLKSPILQKICLIHM